METFRVKSILLKTLLCTTCLLSMPAIADRQIVDPYTSISNAHCATPTESQSGVHLDCKTYYQTTNYTCGPAAVMTMMRYYGRLTPAEMNPRTELRIALEMGATDKGTTQGQMSRWLSTNGFKVDSGIRVESDTIIKNLKQKIPTIITINHHWILAVGLEQESNGSDAVIQFSDSCCGVTEMSASSIDSIWQEAELSKLHGNSCDEEGQYIIATPH